MLKYKATILKDDGSMYDIEVEAIFMLSAVATLSQIKNTRIIKIEEL